MTEDKRLPERINRALNGPQRPTMPTATPFLVEDAEAEIRRSVNRHYEMQAQIAELTTDRDHWKNEAQVFKTDNERLVEKVKDLEAYRDELKDAITTLKTQFETGGQVWLSMNQTLSRVAHIKLLVSPALEQLTKPEEE